MAGALLLAAPVAGQGAPCADALHAGEVAEQEAAAKGGADPASPELVVADLTLDGAPDAVYWWADSARVVLVIGACEGGEVAERWRFEVELPGDCPPADARGEAAADEPGEAAADEPGEAAADEPDARGAVRVEPASLMLDEALVARTCAGEASASECAHLRRENERRRALMEAGGRALRVGGASCTVETLRWSPGPGGFLRIPG